MFLLNFSLAKGVAKFALIGTQGDNNRAAGMFLQARCVFFSVINTYYNREPVYCDGCKHTCSANMVAGLATKLS